MRMSDYTFTAAGSLSPSGRVGEFIGDMFYVKGFNGEPIGVVVKWATGKWSASPEYRWTGEWSKYKSRNGFASRKEATIWLQGVKDAKAAWMVD